LIFFELTSEEIHRGMDIVYDSVVYREALNMNDPLICFMHDSKYLNLAMLWIDCNRDMVMTKLVYNPDQ
jgi:hypothetical protein